MTDAGLGEFGRLKALASLNLLDTAVTDVGLKKLATHDNLTSLNLRGTGVTDAGVMEFQTALPKCEITK